MIPIARWFGGILLSLFLTCSSATSQEWTATGHVEKTGSIYVAPDDTPGIVQLADTGSDDYFLTGQWQMSRAKAAVHIGIGKFNSKAKGPSPSVGIIKNTNGTLAFSGSWKTVPKLDELWVHFSLHVIGDKAELQVLLPDYKAASLTVPVDRRSLSIMLQGAKLRNLVIHPLPKLPALMVPVTIDHAVNARLSGEGADGELGGKIDLASLPRGVQIIDGVPFCFPDTADGQAIDVFKLSQSVRKITKENPARSYAEQGYSLKVPGDQYSAVHLIAFSSRRAQTAPRLTVKMGFVEKTADEWVQQSADVPYLTDAKSDKVMSSFPFKLAGDAKGYLHHIRLPIPQTGQLREYDQLAIQFTRKVEVLPDEFLRPIVEPPSGTVILAVALERSPVEMTYTTDERCNLFSEGQKAVFNLKLTNRSGQKVVTHAFAKSSGPGLPKEQNPRWSAWTVEQSVVLEPGESKSVPLDVTPKARGWFNCTIGVETAGQLQQVRETTFVYLAPDTRKARDDSPFGIWCYWEGHAVTADKDRTEKFYNIINKGGWRWTLSGPGLGYDAKGLARKDAKALQAVEQGAAIHRYMEEKYKFKVTFAKPPANCKEPEKDSAYRGPLYDPKGFDAKVLPWLDWAKKVGLESAYYVLHESRFDGDAILMNFGEMLGGQPYSWKPQTKALFDQQVQNTLDYCRALRKAAPDAKIVLVNDGAQYAFEYMKAGFPADAFDVLGLELYGYQHLPEAQPDWLTVLGDLYTNKRMQAKYGYNKPVWATEALYHSTRPGEMWMHEQGVLMVREAMICLAYGVERMAACNTTNDCANSYGKSLWGRAGVCFRDPEYNPKTSFAMYAWLTQVLDQAKYAGKLKHNTTSLHALDFKTRDGRHVYPFWVVSGKQRVTLQVQDDKAIVYDCYGNTLPVKTVDGQITLEVTDTPIYLARTVVSAIAGREPIEIMPPKGEPLHKFDDLKQIKPLEAPNKSLNKIGVTPQVQGQYRTAITTVDGKQALQIELLDDKDERKLLPRYGEFELAKPIPLPSRPFALNVHAKGNGGWGKLILELTDAKGHKFTSISDGAAGNRGLPYFVFDGWQTMSIPLPGQFQADPTVKWPANESWQANGPVVYPLKLTKITVLMRPHILYIDEERNVENRSIYLESVSVTEAPEGM